MKLEEVELRRIRMSLVSPFQTTFGTQTERDVLLVHVAGPDVEGWGECVALSEPVYSPEYVEGAVDVIVRHLLPRLAALGDPAAHLVAGALADIKGHQMAKAALEMAILDAELRLARPLLRDLFGGRAGKSAVGGSRGRHRLCQSLAGRGGCLRRPGLYADQAEDRARLGPGPGPRRPGAIRR